MHLLRSAHERRGRKFHRQQDAAALSRLHSGRFRATSRVSTGSTCELSMGGKSIRWFSRFGLPVRINADEDLQPTVNVDLDGGWRHPATIGGFGHAQAVELHVLERKSHLFR